MLITTEGAQPGSVHAHGFLRDAVVLSDDADQFAVGRHALCWVHAERLLHKLAAFTDDQRVAQQNVRGLICDFYADLNQMRSSHRAIHRRPRQRGSDMKYDTGRP